MSGSALTDGAFCSTPERAPSPSESFTYSFRPKVCGYLLKPLSQYSQEMIQKRRWFFNQMRSSGPACQTMANRTSSCHGRLNLNTEQSREESKVARPSSREVQARTHQSHSVLNSSSLFFTGVKCLIPFVPAGSGESCQKWDDLWYPCSSISASGQTQG